MDAADILRALEADGFRLAAEGDRIRIEPGTIDDGKVELIREHKPQLLALLRGAPAPASDAGPRLDDLEEPGRSAGWRIYHALLSPRQESAQERAREAHGEASGDDPLEAEATLRAPAAPLTDTERARLTAWLTEIGEDDPVVIEAFWKQVARDIEARAYYLRMTDALGRDADPPLAPWERTQAAFQGLTAREWLARYAPERLPKGDKPESYPVARVAPGNDFYAERERRGRRG